MRAASLFSLLLVFSWQVSFAQTIFNMSNLNVTDCEGTLLDSEAGVGGITYGNNENYTFTICSGGKITMSFVSPFCVEDGFDFLRLFDGPDTNSTLLATYTGYSTPPPVVANSGCLTVHFKSDANAPYCGWEAHWTTDRVPPTPPVMTINPTPACSSNTVVVNFSKRILCDSVNPTDFQITGPIPGLFVTGVNGGSQCNNPGDTSNQFTLQLNQGLNENCTYTLVADVAVADNCDSMWHFTLVDSFQLITCPFNVTIDATTDTICSGMCTDLTALVSGSGPNCLTYNYTWSGGLPNASGPHSVCPTSNTTYTVSVQSTLGGPVVNASKNIVVVNPQITDPDTIVICQSVAPFNINATGGGLFSGPGITNSTTGLFDPAAANYYANYVKYGYPGYCQDSILVYVTPIDAGLDIAACPGSSPFQLNPVFPPGGIWSGTNVSPGGLFYPLSPGVYTVTYSANGCNDTRTITVDTIVQNTPIGSICQSDPAFIISMTPAGGRWTGPGIDSITGRFDPGAGAGNKTLVYKVNGCSYTINLTVKPINAGPDITVCPLQSSFLITPAGSPFGGSWSGSGIVNFALGIFDPALPFGGGTGNVVLTYSHFNGCTDQKLIRIRNTVIDPDTMTFCPDDTALELNNTNTGSSPSNGIWSGPSVVNIGGDYFFRPTIAGPGLHAVTYTVNTCTDVVIMVVFPTQIKSTPSSAPYPDTTVCSTHPAFNFPTMPPGGTWNGPGIVNTKTGLFNPALAPPGTHTIRYLTPGNCVDDSILVTVYNFVPAKILNLDSLYCFKDTAIQLALQPPNGQFTGIGVDTAFRFNPSVAGAGIHSFTYAYGVGECFTADTVMVEVTPELTTNVSVSDYTLCPGENSEITVNVSGGKPNTTPTFEWNEGLFPVNSHIVSPTQTTLYIVRTSDGCSDDVIDSITISVSSKINVDIATSEELCYGLDGWAKINFEDSASYAIQWQTEPPQTTDSITGTAGSSYQVIITDPNSSCFLDTTVRLPSYKNVTAKFSVSPNLECIPSDQKTVTFLDLSQNADSGSWQIESEIIPYQLGVNPTYTFEEAGQYNVKLTVFNKGGCNDSQEMEICVEDITPIFVADAFTPNGDGINDVLHVKAQGIKDLVFIIYDRWGVPVFRSEDVDNGWDGTVGGIRANPGVYIWVVESKLINNETVTKRGNVTLVR